MFRIVLLPDVGLTEDTFIVARWRCKKELI
jgi:hypothetical protein